MLPMLAAKAAVMRLYDNVPALIEDYERLSNAYVAVGWSGDAKYPDGTRVAQVAVWNEFGTRNRDGSVRTPARPFIRPAYYQNRPAINTLRKQVVERINERRMTPFKGLDIMGFRMMAWIQAVIKSNVGPPLASAATNVSGRPSTLERKRAAGRPAVTLIDTRRMLDSLTYHIYTEPMRPGVQSETARKAQAAARHATERAAEGAKAKLVKIRTLNQIRREKRALRRELAKAKAQKRKADARAERRQVKRFKASVRRDKARARTAEKRQVKRFKASVRRDKARARSNEKRAQKRFKASVRRDKKRARANEKRANKRFRASVRRDRKAARKFERSQTKKVNRMAARDRRRATKKARHDAGVQRRKAARGAKRDNRALKKLQGQEKRANARMARRDQKVLAHTKAMDQRSADRMFARAKRQVQGLARVEHLTPEQKQRKADREKVRRAEQAKQNKLKRDNARRNKNEREAGRKEERAYRKQIKRLKALAKYGPTGKPKRRR